MTNGQTSLSQTTHIST